MLFTFFGIWNYNVCRTFFVVYLHLFDTYENLTWDFKAYCARGFKAALFVYNKLTLYYLAIWGIGSITLMHTLVAVCQHQISEVK